MNSSEYHIAVLPGDGIGPEVMAACLDGLKVAAEKFHLRFRFTHADVGGGAYDKHGSPLPEQTLKLAKEADSVLLGAVGGPRWDGLDYSVRPERGLLGLRSEMVLYANLRPAKIFGPLTQASTLKEEVVRGVDLLVIRELVGGLYFGKPKGIESLPDGGERGFNTLVYTTPEIDRIARIAFEVARKRNKKVTSVDKANVLESSELWRRVVTRIGKTDYPDVTLEHMYVDNCAMQLIRNPKQFDVIVTSNMFGDILSDEAAMLTGSIGMLPSASLNGKKGMYEPVHGSAPDIAGQDKANPIATVLSAAMMLKYSFDQMEAAEAMEGAVLRVLEKGYRTADIAEPGKAVVGTREMASAISEELKKWQKRN